MGLVLLTGFTYFYLFMANQVVIHIDWIFIFEEDFSSYTGIFFSFLST